MGAGHWEEEVEAGHPVAAEVEDWPHHHTWVACPGVAEEPRQVPCPEERYNRRLRNLHSRRQPGRQELVAAREQRQGVQRTRLELLRSRNRRRGPARPREEQRRGRASRSRHGGYHVLAAAKEPRHSQAGRAARASHHGHQGSRRGLGQLQCGEVVRLERHQTVRS